VFLINDAAYFKEQDTPVVAEPLFLPGNAERLAGKPRAQDVEIWYARSVNTADVAIRHLPEGGLVCPFASVVYVARENTVEPRFFHAKPKAAYAAEQIDETAGCQLFLWLRLYCSAKDVE
jgi:hypothetical protein